ncbi:universal stress protein [Natronorubrum sp. JWXQ-INN-674]|uniref:Universal stress protein n=1 Tax=Natronorubrum halalkaliphilum TaxID=2691917 RepID=A0A6B0VR19_9EURY|nr:universal stress protein [Natronorubrum halalkaliphilum]MXV63924.1 universal stress protein [Natronorubrum halalkaliphilum]
MYDTILVPTDGSPGAEPAIENALDLARRYDASVHALSVIDVAELMELDYLGDRTDFERTIEPLEDAAKDAVQTVVAQARERDADLEVVTVVRQGIPFEVILEYADRIDADLIVMGTHGRRGLSRFLLGSTTERIVRASPVPVLTVRFPEDSEGSE